MREEIANNNNGVGKKSEATRYNGGVSFV